MLIIVFLGYAVYKITSDFEDFANLQTVQNFLTPPLLSLLLIPFLFALALFIAYENVLKSLQNFIPDGYLRAYAKVQAVFRFRQNVELLRRWFRDVRILRPTDKSGIRQSIEEVKKGWDREKNPPIVDSVLGWCPYRASEYLKEKGIRTNDYHRSFDLWSASSPYKEIGDGFPKDNVAYYVKGNEHAATHLTLILNVNNASNPSNSEQYFFDLAIFLLEMAISNKDAKELFNHLHKQDGEQLQIRNKQVRLWRESWNSGIEGGYTWELMIEHRK